MSAVIALVGRPNVGKSTLFNVLTKSRDAIVADYPGLTRDRKYGHVNYEGYQFTVIDTGGLSGEREEIDESMAQQTLLAIKEADVVLFIVDARDGATVADENIASQLRKMGKQAKLVVNKIDGLDERVVASEFYALGFDQPALISASNKRGIKSLLEKVTGEKNQHNELEITTHQPEGIRVAIVGRPNVGKSTLVNRILGEERVVVFDMPGTTRDSIQVPFEKDGKKYVLIDTAGVRRKRSVNEAVEKFSVIKAMQAIDSSNVAIMMIDATQEVADQDLHILGYIIESGRALILVFNKWDGLDEHQKQKIRNELDQKVNFIDFAEVFYISALHGSNVGDLYAAINRAYDSAFVDLATPVLTEMLHKAVEMHQPPLVRGRRIKLRYAHQGGLNPPRIIIHGNQVQLVPDTYKRYLANYFQQRMKIKGTPVVIEFKGGSNPFAGRKNVLTERQKSKRQRMIRFIKQKAKQKKKR